MTLSLNRRRPGFTMMELLIVLIIVAIAGAVALPSIGRMMAGTKINRSAALVSVELQQARSLAGRTRRPVRFEVNAANRVIRVRDHITPATVFSESWFNAQSETGVQAMVAAPTQVVMFPNGLASGDITITLTEAGHQRQIFMTRAGQVRITTP